MKTSLVGDGANLLKMSLEDDTSLNGSNKQFNQFAGKSTTYTDDFYSTTIDRSKVSKELE